MTMELSFLKPKKALSRDKAFYKLKLDRGDVDRFKDNLLDLLGHLKKDEHEEHHKNDVSDFLKKTFYDPNYYINTYNRTDLVIHEGRKSTDSVNVMIETKKTSNKSEMATVDNINVKAFQELVLYYLRERISNNNQNIKHLIITNNYEWFIFDAHLFESLFAKNKKFVKKFEDFELKSLSGKDTDYFYKEVAQPFIAEITQTIEFVYFDIRDYEKYLKKESEKESPELLALFKIFSPQYLLKLRFENDSNTLDKPFYNELLHIIGLEETKQGSKKVIGRCSTKTRLQGSLIENTITQLDSLDKIQRLPNASSFGDNHQEQLFNVSLELVITWVNRILFLKLLEGQLLSYHKGDSSYKFFSLDKIKNFDDLNSLFFQVLAKVASERPELEQEKFPTVPYLNSSLFEPTELEHTASFISNLRDELQMPFHKSTVLKGDDGKKKAGEISNFDYLVSFLNSYDFGANESGGVKEDSRSIINASVLGLIFEKINGYKDGSFFTPGFITMYMCRETVRKAVVQKFNDVKGWACKSIDEVEDKLEPSDRQEANDIINSIKICDPAVGSGHFLVSALNEMIVIKHELKVLQDREGKRLKHYEVSVENDELLISDEDELFSYNPKHTDSQRIQETLFHEKQTIIENCLFGVDINPNSVKICRLRLWIELLKNAYYKNELELETLPNIDINIKCGNSLVSRFSLDEDIKGILKKNKLTIESYQSAVDKYRNAKSKEEKREMESLINDIKSNLQTEISGNSKEQRSLDRLSAEMYQRFTGPQLFEEKLTAKQKKDKKILKSKIDKLIVTIDDIKNNKIYDHAFEWRFEFPEVLDEVGTYIGFDVIIGNPPYVAVSSISIPEREYMFSRFLNASSRIDLFGLFTEFGLFLLREQGVLSYIIPMQFLKNTAFKNIRENLLTNASILKINHVGTNIFLDANNDTIVFEYKKEKPKKDHFIEVSLSKAGQSKLLTERKFYTDQELFCKYDFAISLSSTEELNICSKLENSESYRLQDRCDVIQGIVTGLNDAFIFDGAVPENIETDNLQPYLLGSDFKSYSVNTLSDKKILYLNKEADITKFPVTEKWLKPFKCKLDRRREVVKGSIPWYSLQWARSKKQFESPKVILQKIRNPTLKKRLVGTLDESNYYLGDGVIFLTSKNNNVKELKYILGLLNSELYNFFYRKNFLDINLKVMYLEVTPIIELTNKDLIIDLVDKILARKMVDEKSDTSDLEDKIDCILYSCLGVTKEEIEIIESRV